MTTRLEGQDIVCVSVMDWEHPFASSRHHLMRALAQQNRVLFVDNQTNPMRVLKGLSQAPMRRKLTTWLGLEANPRQVEKSLWVLNPPPVAPMGKLADRRLFESAYRLNQRALVAGVRKACRHLGFSEPLLWISFNVLSSEGLIGALNERLVIYHCTDEITAMEEISPFAGEIERRLLTKSDLVLTSSRRLLEDKQVHNPCCFFVPNGADTHLFEQALDAATPLHPEVAKLKGPVIGFAGHVEARFDFELLAAVARARPNWSFAIAGPIDASRATAAQKLSSLPNVHFLGLIERSALPGFLKGVDVAVIPFVRSRQTRAIYPLKLNEYLAAGKPVVVTPFADLREFEGVIETADTPEGFIQSIERAIATDSESLRLERLALARSNHWSRRIEQIERHLLEALAARPC